jgi:hypothetical protein
MSHLAQDMNNKQFSESEQLYNIIVKEIENSNCKGFIGSWKENQRKKKQEN